MAAMQEFPNRIQLYIGDITLLQVDAVVTAANEALIGGGGVDGAIHSAAGPQLLEASRKLAPCPAGTARMTAGFDLNAQHVIHAVGPIYRDGNHGESDILASTYRAALTLAAENTLCHISFPCISTGAFSFPNQQACMIAIDTTLTWMNNHLFPKVVTFCCFEKLDHELYARRLDDTGEI